MNLQTLINAAFLSVIALCQKTLPVDNLALPGPIIFDHTAFHLIESSKPIQRYSKQEYLPQGQSITNYSNMILIEYLAENISPQQAVAAKAQEIAQRKTTDSIANFAVYSATDPAEYSIDFLMRQGNIVEWNLYRYRTVANGLALYGLSIRAYDAELQKFVLNLSSTRTKMIPLFLTSPFPAIHSQ